jgi:hypothetical protein
MNVAHHIIYIYHMIFSYHISKKLTEGGKSKFVNIIRGHSKKKIIIGNKTNTPTFG